MWNDTSSSPEIARSRAHVVGDHRVVGAKHRPERRDTGAARGDATAVEVVAEDIDAIGTGQVVEFVAVEIGDLHAGAGLQEAAALQVLAHVAAELEGHPVAAGELQVGNAFRRFAGQCGRAGKPCPDTAPPARRSPRAAAGRFHRARHRQQKNCASSYS